MNAQSAKPECNLRQGGARARHSRSVLQQILMKIPSHTLAPRSQHACVCLH